MENNFVETLVGALVIAVAGGFLTYGYTMTDAGNVQGLNITAEFDRVDGLANGADVRLSGIKVGTVTSQTLNPANYAAVVAVSLSSDIKIPVDSSAKITSEGLLGGTYVSVTPGGSEDFLTDGDEIQFTQGSIDLIGLVGQAIFSAQDSK
ncbi:MAG: outer membrane lipid asymmetry maintenance protein MlaD [Parvibaculaceae bacterium]|nr:outer membrane lipid asymmetry maintenance protein MlaD [Parvibaculaceae bacterium]